MTDAIDPHELERLRRSVAMLRPDQPAGLRREQALRLLDELQRLRRSDQGRAELVGRLRALLDQSDGSDRQSDGPDRQSDRPDR